MPEPLDLAAVLSTFTRHSHPDTDEMFLVLSGSLTIRLDTVNTGDTPSDFTAERRLA